MFWMHASAVLYALFFFFGGLLVSSLEKEEVGEREESRVGKGESNEGAESADVAVMGVEREGLMRSRCFL